MYKKYVKRLIDVILALMVLPFVFLVTVVVAPIIYISDPGPVFYKGLRRGMGGKTFKMLKFRSMYVNAPDIRNKDGSTYNSDSDKRVTKIGRLLRKTSIDELPQVLNVLKGDMSWIGPRASVPKEGYTWYDLDEIQRKRLTVRPGLTGYTAALYRNSIPQEEKHKWDCYYVDHINFLLDMKIVILTIKTVILRKNIYTNDGTKNET